MRFFILAASLFSIASLAQADVAQVDQYYYGYNLDVSRVLSIKVPQSDPACQPVTAVMTYEDSNGAIRKIAYQVLSEDCRIQN